MAFGLDKTNDSSGEGVPLLEQAAPSVAAAEEVDIGNDGSVSDNEEEDDHDEEDDDEEEEGGNDNDEEDSAQGLPKGGLCWQSDRSASRASSEEDGAVSPIPSFTAAGGGGGVGAGTTGEAETMQVVVEVPEGSSSSSSRQTQVDKVPASPTRPQDEEETIKAKEDGKVNNGTVVSDTTTKPDNNNSNKRKRTDDEEEEEEEKEQEAGASGAVSSSSTGAAAASSPPSSPAPAPHSRLNEYQRQLRNAREKRRSGKICDQFDHIRDTMVKAGVIVPKGTKGTILAAAKEYIALLQEQQRRVVLDNCMLVHQVQRIGEGALGASASNAVRQVAAKNGVSDIVWPNSTSRPGGGRGSNNHQGGIGARNNKENQNRPPGAIAAAASAAAAAAPDYGFAFRKSPVAMAIATLGGSFMDCNDQFCQLSGLNKQQVTAQTIFTLINQEELTNAFDRISQWLFSISPPPPPQADTTTTAPPPQARHEPIVLKSSVKDPSNTDMNLRVCLTPVKEQETLKYLCVTLTARPPCSQQIQFPTVAANVTTANPVTTTTTLSPLALSANNNPNTAQQQAQKTDQSTDSFFAVG